MTPWGGKIKPVRRHRFEMVENAAATRADGTSSLRSCGELETSFYPFEDLIAVATGGGGIRSRPIFDLDGHGPGEFQSLMVGLRRERYDKVEGSVFKVGDCDGTVLGDIDSDFVHDRCGERIGLSRPHPGRADVNPVSRKKTQDRRGHGRPDRIPVAGKQHGLWMSGRGGLNQRFRR
jgi:hypothetical protein